MNSLWRDGEAIKSEIWNSCMSSNIARGTRGATFECNNIFSQVVSFQFSPELELWNIASLWCVQGHYIRLWNACVWNRKTGHSHACVVNGHFQVQILSLVLLSLYNNACYRQHSGTCKTSMLCFSYKWLLVRLRLANMVYRIVSINFANVEQHLFCFIYYAVVYVQIF